MEFKFDPRGRRLHIRTLLPEGRKPRVPDELFQFGIEEEYFLSDSDTFAVPAETPDALFEAADWHATGHIGREFLQAQIEVATEPHSSLDEVRFELMQLRHSAAAAAAEHGLSILASGTHPLAQWRESVPSPKQRYAQIMDDLQMIGQRDMVCGLHIHVEFNQPALRFDVMNRIIPYVPLFIALSASSPFWQNRATGLKCYRLAAYDEIPRTGLPELFRSEADYNAYVDTMVRSQAIPDASHIWWAIRPSVKYPTLELRAPDCCTRLDDTIAIAALYRVLVRFLCGHPEHNAGLDAVDRALAVENKWRAQRYGVQSTFVTRSGGLAVGKLLDRVIELTASDAEALGCRDQVRHCRVIVLEGTSADAQLRIFTENERLGDEIALHKVAKWIRDATLMA